MPPTLMNNVFIKSLTNNLKKRVDRGSNTPMVKCHPFGTLVTAKNSTLFLWSVKRQRLDLKLRFAFKVVFINLCEGVHCTISCTNSLAKVSDQKHYWQKELMQGTLLFSNQCCLYKKIYKKSSLGLRFGEISQNALFWHSVLHIIS